MIELHSITPEPAAVFERRSGVPEIHELHERETAVILIDVAADALPGAIGSSITEVEAAMDEAGVALAGPPFARFLEMGDRVRAEAGFPVMRPAPRAGRVVPGRLPGGHVASVVHAGPYDDLRRTYGELHVWLAELGLQPSGPLWEVYWSGPGTEADSSRWRTEILAAVE